MAEPVELRGLKELEENLQRLGSVAGARVMRQALFAATKPILDQAKANIRAWPHGSGALELSMGRTFRVKQGRALLGTQYENTTSARVSDEGGTFTILIGPRLNALAAVALHNLYYGRRRTSIYYGHLLEFGHRQATTKTGRLSRGTYQGAVTYFSNYFGKSITRSGVAAAGTMKPGHVGGGTVHPQRFLKPALDSAGLRASFVFQNELRRRIERALKKQDPGAANA